MKQGPFLVGLLLIILYGLNIVYSFTSGRQTNHHEVEGAGGVISETEQSHHAKWTLRFAVIVLVAATVGTALVSEAPMMAVALTRFQLWNEPSAFWLASAHAKALSRAS